MFKFTGAPGELVIENLEPKTTYDFDAKLVTEEGVDDNYKQFEFTTSLNLLFGFIISINMLLLHKNMVDF